MNAIGTHSQSNAGSPVTQFGILVVFSPKQQVNTIAFHNGCRIEHICFLPTHLFLLHRTKERVGRVWSEYRIGCRFAEACYELCLCERDQQQKAHGGGVFKFEV